jgi:hypothetical protein
MRPATLPNGILVSSCNAFSVAGWPMLAPENSKIARPTVTMATIVDWRMNHLAIDRYLTVTQLGSRNGRAIKPTIAEAWHK